MTSSAPERSDLFVHPSAVVEAGAVIGSGTRIWHNSHVRAGSLIGADCTVGFSVYIDAGARVGDRCKIQNHVSIYDGVQLEDEVFVGPAATFTNDLYPRACPDEWEVSNTFVRTGASIGASATIVCGVEIGAWSLVAAGAVVSRDVPPHGLVVGHPAHMHSWVCRCARRLARVDAPLPTHCAHCGRSTEGILG
ncbi:MAG: acetyltransferase [Acidimicrobiia bacterium]|nr:acetyltransferase [Acidimicrobiia bacterium]